MAKTVAPEQVVYLAPETLMSSDMADKLAATNDPDEVIAILNARPTTGEYRMHPKDLSLQEGPEGTTVLGPDLGDLVVWVDEAPDDRENGDGHFEAYSAKQHGEPYNPIFRGAS